ncbi:SMEK domain-containing protein [Rhizobium laguerreae]|uniref:SMEK domain-containing protein n=1 Tax=Rhizobium laguerreae TaxID=1076926 RepID=UPI001C908E58|nr:SMEK domain-containing protein [Rhizobium laguerreae]MBY3258843.1 SMEK domain-containing protein [Rhizobium laguerreae]MBY3282016.1 SMEK domain-containing protein [Rhizobium laguerreae]MBY3293306.1 SMEK domain-containing protein [Rhizobium laguerreae]
MTFAKANAESFHAKSRPASTSTIQLFKVTSLRRSVSYPPFEEIAVLEVERVLERIVVKLSVLEVYPKRMSSLGLNDSAILSENFFMELFNRMYGLALKVELLPNAPAIDLKDRTAKVAYQVTVRQDTAKIKECTDMFRRHGFDQHYNELRIFIVGSSTAERNQPPIGACAVSIVDMADVLREIRGFDIATMKRIAELIDSYISFDAMTVTQTEIIRFLAVEFKNTIDEGVRPQRNGGFEPLHYWTKADIQYEDLKCLIWKQEPTVDPSTFQSLDRYLGFASVALDALRAFAHTTAEFRQERFNELTAKYSELKVATTRLLEETRVPVIEERPALSPNKGLLSRSLSLFQRV